MQPDVAYADDEPDVLYDRGPVERPLPEETASAQHEVEQPAAAAPPPARAWLTDAADLLAEPDPGPTPWLVDGLIVDGAIVAAVGRWKTTKSYGLLDVCIAVATGRPAFGRLAIPAAGPVVFVNEESGRAALWRRLDALCRGRAIDPEELRGRLHVAANARILLDDAGWQNELLDVGAELRPRLFVFDPLARMKGAGRDENAQREMAVPIEFVRELRDRSGAAVCFVHHVGHTGGQMRGSSDLESIWETRLTWERDGQAPLVTIKSEHREAEAGDPISYRIGWDGETRSMRFELDETADPDAPTIDERIVAHLADHPGQTVDEIRQALEIGKRAALDAVGRLDSAGTTHRARSGRRDRAGRIKNDNAVYLASQRALWSVSPDETNHDRAGDADSARPGRSPGPAPLGATGTDRPRAEPTDEEADRLLRDHADIANGDAW